VPGPSGALPARIGMGIERRARFGDPFAATFKADSSAAPADGGFLPPSPSSAFPGQERSFQQMQPPDRVFLVSAWRPAFGQAMQGFAQIVGCPQQIGLGDVEGPGGLRMTIQKGEPIANPGIRAQQRLQLQGKRGGPLRQSGLFPDGAWGAASASSGSPRTSLGIRGTDAKRIAFPRKTPRGRVAFPSIAHLPPSLPARLATRRGNSPGAGCGSSARPGSSFLFPVPDCVLPRAIPGRFPRNENGLATSRLRRCLALPALSQGSDMVPARRLEDVQSGKGKTVSAWRYDGEGKGTPNRNPHKPAWILNHTGFC